MGISKFSESGATDNKGMRKMKEMTLAPGKLFHELSVALSDSTAYDVAQLINCAISNAVVNKQPLPSFLNNPLFRQHGQVLTDVRLAHAAQLTQFLYRMLFLVKVLQDLQPGSAGKSPES